MRVVLHLGYPRTGSTFLQTNVFPKHKEINFLGPKKGNCCVYCSYGNVNCPPIQNGECC